MKTNIIEKVVKKNLCIGCGVCSGICPTNNLEMRFNQDGEYIPVEVTNCLDKCTLCFDVCPFYDQNDNEDVLGRNLFGGNRKIKYESELGYYYSAYVAYSAVDNQREKGSSGGIATWYLDFLLKQKMVDYIICVFPNSDSNKLFKFKVIDAPNMISCSSGSAYYPVEMSEVISFILKNPGRYAITGVPCFIKGLRLLAQKNSRIRKRIVVTIGLVCGQMKNKQYTSYAASLSGVDGKLREVYFRGKSKSRPSNNYRFSCSNNENKKGQTYYREGLGKVWSNRWFTPNACNYCDDIFAETADIVVMDAWLPKYFKESRGTNLIVIRNKFLEKIFKQSIDDKEVVGEEIDIQKVIQSQAGVLKVKRDQLSYRLFLGKKNNVPTINKRVSPSRKINFFIKKEVELKNIMQILSKKLFKKYYTDEIVNQKLFCNGMNKYLNKLKFYTKILLIVKFPLRIMRKLRRSIYGDK